jgi:hypothetical protein
MCYYDQYRMPCGDFKWGNFRAHCSKELRTGETCGMKLVWETYQLEDKCKYCLRIDVKKGKIRKEQERIKRWAKEGQRFFSIESSEVIIDSIENEIQELQSQRTVNKYGERFGLTHDLAANTKTLDQKVTKDINRDAVRLLHTTTKVE